MSRWTLARVCALSLALVSLAARDARAADARAFARLVAARYHVDMGHVATADIDRDGDLDVVLATDRGFLVWVNDGAGTFTSRNAKHRSMIDGRGLAGTWDASERSRDEGMPNGAPSTPMAVACAHAPPALDSASITRSHAPPPVDCGAGCRSPRAPPRTSAC